MPDIGSGVGGNVGGPTIPLQEDIKATAWTEVNKQYLGIVKDSIEQAFTQMNPRYITAGFFGGYRSSEDQPLLDHPLENMRVLQGFAPLSDDDWKSNYNALVKQLPAEIQTRLNEEMSKNFEDRSAAFTALDNLLSLTARLQAKLNMADEPSAPESPIAVRTTYNQMFPFIAMQGMIEQGHEIVHATKEHVMEKGANYFHFDGLNHMIDETSTALEDLKQLLSEARESGGDQRTLERLTLLADHTEALKSEFQRSNYKEELQILGPTLNVLSMISTAWSVSGTGSPTLFIGLTLALIGVESSQSTGLFGNSFSKLARGVAQGVQSTLIPEANIGQKKMLELLAATSFGLLAGLTSSSVESGFGPFPLQHGPGHVQSARFFAFELALLLAQSSGALQSVFETFAQAAGSKGKATADAGELLAQSAALIMILTAVRQGRQDPSLLVEGNEKYLEKAAQTASKLFINGENEAGPPSVALEQAKIALSNQDHDGFLQVFANLLDNIDTSLEELTNDIKTISDSARVITNHAADTDDQPITGIINIV